MGRHSIKNPGDCGFRVIVKGMKHILIIYFEGEINSNVDIFNVGIKGREFKNDSKLSILEKLGEMVQFTKIANTSREIFSCERVLHPFLNVLKSESKEDIHLEKARGQLVLELRRKGKVLFAYTW